MIEASIELKPRPKAASFHRFEWVASICITAAVYGLHFFFLSHVGAFWRDEVNLMNLAGTGSLHEMARDSFPILIPLLVHGWRLEAQSP